MSKHNYLIYGIGFIAQGLFSSRLIIQWFLSERQKKVVTPALFWVLSLLASILLFAYGYLRHDFAIMLGQCLTYFIYIRNLQLQNHWRKIHIVVRGIIYLLPGLLVVYYFNNNIIDIDRLFKNEDIPFWLLILGIISQVLFTLRFVYQWIYSEKNKESILPMGFWVLSNLGSLLIFTYAIFRRDPVLLIGHLMGISIYTRNIMLLIKQND
ncbi:lipid-A-disaccharide synthase N-terminal domain-containing protein [Gaoshiqia sediminis]|uniref:Lipid-A-disaccharide synthase N-terminal domain-containing protein n=1 Tax=Gaoshiqia sediminis TaxID=2986998 RepID=A0AA41YA81_9BACT|nr:lipid-A-disaccharide synthase N-terminal domain-containing protein [Gaoshiqia sediminis]MCW0484845.1 lipid-A-disaccharide synthase N-terminal domain-containing protein [Gaoshiqia sediminis]